MDSVDREQCNRMRQLRESYEEWQRLGRAALARGDFPSLADAVQAEAAIMREQWRVFCSLKERA